jgi:E3 ubiquitin-protein ligase synoviolin
MERSPNISWIFHIRLLSLLTLLSLADMTGVKLAYDTTTTKGASVQLVFGFEYAILLVSVLNVAIKYILHVVDYVRANNNRGDNASRNWEEKAVYLLYSELALSASKVILYLTFITLMMKIHTFPLFAIRPMYLSMRSFKKALNDVIQSRRAIANMNSLYPNATTQELLETDNVCIICREEMVGTTVINGQVIHPPSGLSKKLPCGHIFHVSCLRSWFQRQQTCPTCRLDVLRAGMAARNNNNNNVNLNNNNMNVGGNRVQGVLDPAQDLLQRQQQLMQNMFLTHLFMNQLHAGANLVNNPAVNPLNVPVPSTSNSQQSEAGSSSTQDNNQSPTTSANSSATTPLVIGMPLPPSNVNLSSLSDDELRRLVRSEREGLEARLRLYSQSRILIDAAITNLMQFNSLLEATGPVLRGQATPSNVQDIRAEDRTGVNIPTDLVTSTSGDEPLSNTDSDGRVLSEEEMFRRRTNSDVRRVRVSRFTGSSTESSQSQGRDNNGDNNEA